MKTKLFLFIILVLSLSLGVFTACGDNEETSHTHEFTALKFNETEHWYECFCGETVSTKDAHFGGTATCTKKAVCKDCGAEYGDVLEHAYGDYTANGNGTKTSECACGDKQTVIDEEVFVVEDSVIIDLTEYGNTLSMLVVPEGIVGIHDNAFRYSGSLDSITFPSTLTYIGKKAFESSSVTSLVIPKSVVTIDDEAFTMCWGLTSVTFEENGNLEVLGKKAFYRCQYLKSFDFGGNDKLKEIKHSTFFYNYLLESIVIPNSVEIIEDIAFYDCRALKSVIMPDSIYCVYEDVFWNCSNLEYLEKDGLSYLSSKTNDYIYLADIVDHERTSYTIQDGAKIIGYRAFENVYNGVSIEIPNSIVNFTETGINSLAKLNYNVKNGLKYLGNKDNPYLFLIGAEDKFTANAVIDDNCKFIGDKAFYGNSLLTSVNMPKNLQVVGSCAFWECRILESDLVFPSTLTRIGQGAFRNCSRLEKITFSDDNNLFSIDDGAFVYTRIENLSFGKNTTLKILRASAFYDCVFLKNIELPNSLKEIGYSVFYNCSQVKTVVIPNGVKKIDSYAFNECSALESIYIPSSVVTMANWVFRSCPKLTINCQAESLPSTWNDEWNDENHKVVWNYKI